MKAKRYFYQHPISEVEWKGETAKFNPRPPLTTVVIGKRTITSWLPKGVAKSCIRAALGSPSERIKRGSYFNDLRAAGTSRMDELKKLIGADTLTMSEIYDRWNETHPPFSRIYMSQTLSKMADKGMLKREKISNYNKYSNATHDIL